MDIHGEMQTMIIMDELLVFPSLMKISGDKSYSHQELDHNISRGEEAQKGYERQIPRCQG